jgi:hypothetical protein
MQEPSTGCHTPLTHAELGNPLKPALQVPWQEVPLAVPLHCPAGQAPLVMVLSIASHTVKERGRWSEHGQSEERETLSWRPRQRPPEQTR